MPWLQYPWMLQRFCQANPWGRGNSDPWEVPQIFCTHAKVEIMGMISNFATGSLSSLFYHCYQFWYKDCLKYENRMRLVGTPFVPPPPHHHHWHYFDITKLPYQKQYSRHVKKASESESFIDELISGFMMEFHHFLNEYDGILSFCQLAAILWWVPIIW